MKEELQANILTKYVSGQCTPQEEKFLKEWLKSNPSNAYLLGIIQQQLQNASSFLQTAI